MTTLQAIAGNLLAIPLTSLLIMPVALLAVCSLAFGELTLIFKIWDWGLSLLIFIAGQIAHWPGAAILIATPHYLFLAFSIFGGLWLCLWKERWRWWGMVPITLSCVFLFYDHLPHAYISEEVMAYRSDKTLNVSSIKRGSFAVEMWAKELGITEIKLWNKQVVFYPFKGKKITFISDPYLNQKGQKLTYKEITAFVKPHCAQSPWLISNGYAWRICKDKLEPSRIVDRFQLSRKGTHFVWSYPDKIKIVNAQQYFGKRPWRVTIRKIKRAQAKNLDSSKRKP